MPFIRLWFMSLDDGAEIGRLVMWGWKNRRDGARGFMSRLAKSVHGNVMILMGVSLIPLAGMVGGGIDISRMYILKTRLQHACDAGSLAGRRTMGGGTWAFNNYYARGEAEEFFDANFEYDKGTKKGMFGSSNVTRTFSENAGKVEGVASAKIPMTLMRILGKTEDTIAVSCATEMRLPNTDIMFVLDTTGSMGDTPSGDSVTKLQALKTSVKCFYEIVARLDTDAACVTGTPSGGTGSDVQVRFGFVPYATNVNVGRLLKTDWFANSWKYQTRIVVPSGNWSNWEANYATYAPGGGQPCPPPSTPNTVTTQYRNWNGSTAPYNYGGSSYCIYDRRTIGSQWTYDRMEVNVGLLKEGASWKSTFKLPINAGGADRTIGWDGCVEERQTVKATSYSPIPSNAKDLNIDLVPSASDPSSLWGMVLPDVTFTRNGNDGWNRAAITTSNDYPNQSYYACPTESRKLQEWPNATAFDDYVDSLTPEGNTYHDIGLIWGARLSSPTGLFAAENATTPKGGEIERHIIFMTDGDACTAPDNYTAYGVQWFDRRQTADGTAPTGGCISNSFTLTEQVNKRTEALCASIKNQTFNKRQTFTLWVIAFGNLATETETRLKNCATSGRYFKATNAKTLQETFKSIADQISMLRLTQ